jgi:hypothetical protein
MRFMDCILVGEGEYVKTKVSLPVRQLPEATRDRPSEDPDKKLARKLARVEKKIQELI